jgi:hypothetical protein
MAVSTAQTMDVTEVLADLIGDVEGLRVEAYVADKLRPPVAVVGLPVITWNDPEAGFCWATWEVPVTVVTARNTDRDAQTELSHFVRDIAVALNHEAVDGIFMIQMLDARPTTATISGQELPAYLMRVQVRA